MSWKFISSGSHVGQSLFVLAERLSFVGLLNLLVVIIEESDYLILDNCKYIVVKFMYGFWFYLSRFS